MRATKHILITLSGFVAIVVSLSACNKLKGDGQRDGTSIIINLVGTETKAPVITTDELERRGNFVLDAYVDDAYYDYSEEPPLGPYSQGQYISGNGVANVYKMGTKWELTPSVNWIAYLNTRFFSYWPADADLTAATRSISTNSSNPDRDYLDFTYNLTGSLSASTTLLTSGDGSSLRNSGYADADRMDDIIFAFNKINYKKAGEELNIKFYHALSQIRFCVNTEDGTFDRHLVIKQIALRNIKSGGSCRFDGTQTEPENMFNWNTGSGSATAYCHTYDADFTSSVPAGWARGSSVSTDPEYNILTNTNVFFIAPQTWNAQISIVFSDGGTLYERTIDVNDNFEFKPGKYYTYKISASDLGRDVGVTLTMIDWNNYDDKLFI